MVAALNWSANARKAAGRSGPTPVNPAKVTRTHPGRLSTYTGRRAGRRFPEPRSLGARLWGPPCPRAARSVACCSWGPRNRCDCHHQDNPLDTPVQTFSGNSDGTVNAKLPALIGLRSETGHETTARRAVGPRCNWRRCWGAPLKELAECEEPDPKRKSRVSDGGRWEGGRWGGRRLRVKRGKSRPS